MKPSELRIGNFFHRIDRTKEVHIPISIPLKVITIGFDGCDCLHYEQNPALVTVWDNVNYRDMSPIPLTEEWLLKMGFEKDGEGDWQKGDFAFTLGSEGLKLFMEYGFINPPIKFVHQLQNLFYCLTGEELKLTASQSKQL